MFEPNSLDEIERQHYIMQTQVEKLIRAAATIKTLRASLDRVTAERDALRKALEDIWYYFDTLASFLEPDVIAPLGASHVCEIVRGVEYINGIVARLYRDGTLSSTSAPDASEDEARDESPVGPHAVVPVQKG